MTQAAIRTRELSKDYYAGFWRPRPYRALDSLSLEVPPGSVFGFLGPNGAGKTTTLKLLMQLVFPTSGAAEILGRPAGDVAVRRRIGYLPENPYFYDHLTAEELLEYYARLFGMPAAERRARIPATLDRLGIGAERRLALRKFSKGMLQRVGLAQAVINDPEVLFLDEPMSGLDPLGRRDVRALILELRDQGRTIFFSSHILSDAEALCSQVAIVVKGRLAAAGRLTDLQELAIQGWELLVAASILIGQLTAGQDVKIIKDLGLAATSLFGLFIAVFVGINLVSKEVDRRSVYPLFAKPIRRAELILGKYAGLLLTLLVNMAVVTVAIYAVPCIPFR